MGETFDYLSEEVSNKADLIRSILLSLVGYQPFRLLLLTNKVYIVTISSLLIK